MRVTDVCELVSQKEKNMKKIRIIGSIMMVCLLMMGTVYAASLDSCRLNFGMNHVESNIVGTSKEGVFKTKTDADSMGGSYTFCYCAWAGSFFTMEKKFITPVGKTVVNTESQSQPSNYYTKLTSSMGDRTRATAWVEAK